MTQLDRLGTYLGVACAFHCGALPLALVAAPALPHSVELAVALLAAAVAVTAGVRGYRVHKRLSLVLGLLVAAALVLSGHVLHDIPGAWLISPLAGLVLAAMHQLNHRACLHCHTCANKKA